MPDTFKAHQNLKWPTDFFAGQCQGDLVASVQRCKTRHPEVSRITRFRRQLKSLVQLDSSVPKWYFALLTHKHTQAERHATCVLGKYEKSSNTAQFCSASYIARHDAVSYEITDIITTAMNKNSITWDHENKSHLIYFWNQQSWQIWKCSVVLITLLTTIYLLIFFMYVTRCITSLWGLHIKFNIPLKCFTSIFSQQ